METVIILFAASQVLEALILGLLLYFHLKKKKKQGHVGRSALKQSPQNSGQTRTGERNTHEASENA